MASVAAWRLNEDVRAETQTAYRSARESEERFKSAFHDAPISMMLSEHRPEECRAVPPGEPRVVRAPGVLGGAAPRQSLRRHHASRPTGNENMALFDQLIAGELSSYELEKRYLSADGRSCGAQAHVSLVHDSKGEPRYAITQVAGHHRAQARRRADRESQRQLAEAQKLARIGSWEWNLDAGEVTWSEELYRIFGLDPGLTAELRGFSIGSIRRAAQGAGPRGGSRFAARVVPRRVAGRAPGGELRIIEAHGEIVLGDDGSRT